MTALRILATLCTIGLTVGSVWMPAHEGDRFTAWLAAAAGVVVVLILWR